MILNQFERYLLLNEKGLVVNMLRFKIAALKLRRAVAKMLKL
jgi:hypothetical protein